MSFHRRDVDFLVHLGQQPDFRISYASRSSSPSILHACRESRQQGLKWYHLKFERIYFNPQADRLCAMNLRDIRRGYNWGPRTQVSNELGKLYERHKFKFLALNWRGFAPEDLDFLKSGDVKLEELSLIVEPWWDDFKSIRARDWHAHPDLSTTFVCGKNLEAFSAGERAGMNRYLKEDREKIFDQSFPFTDTEKVWGSSLKTTHELATTVHLEGGWWYAYQHALIVRFHH